MDKELKKLIKVIIIILIIGSLALLGAYYYLPRFDEDCLEDLAKSYCEEINETFDYTIDLSKFVCYSKDFNPRLEKSHKFKYYNFLDEEKELCLTKTKKSWRGIKQ